MSALTKPLFYKISGPKTTSFKVKNSSTLYAGSIAAIDSTGYAIAHTGAAGEKVIGRALPTPDPLNLGRTAITGDTNSTPVMEVSCVTEPEILNQVTVTGVTAITDLMKVVYLNGDDQTLTITRPTRGFPIGYITRWYSSTTADVTRFSTEAGFVNSLGGNGADVKLLLYFKMVASHQDLTTATDYVVLTPPYSWSLRTVKATVLDVFAGGTSVVLQPKIGSTAVTGGDLTFNTSASTGGTTNDQIVAGTAISAANTGNEGSALKITATIVGTFTGGSAAVYGTFDRLIGY